MSDLVGRGQRIDLGLIFFSDDRTLMFIAKFGVSYVWNRKEHIRSKTILYDYPM